MFPVDFPGTNAVLKSESNMDIPVHSGVDANGNEYILMCWKPSLEDIQAFMEGRALLMKMYAKDLPDMNLYTLDVEGKSNND